MLPERWPLERIWDRKNVTPSGCWEWTGACVTKGYGHITSGRGRQITVHRVAFELTNGPIPAGMFVLHRCDNPPCFNPEHLFLGTNLDNMRDAKSKGRPLGVQLGAKRGHYKPRMKV